MISHIHHGASESFWVSGALILAVFLYLRGWFGVRSRDHGNVESWRAGSFVFGLLFIWIATASPLAALDHEMLTAHMVQHLLLMTLAPPLILLGMPRKPLAHGLFQRFFRSEPLQQLASVVTHPAFCWFAAAGALVLWHIPSVFMLGLRSQTWHGIEQASFLATGLLFWWPVVQSAATQRSKWPESSILLVSVSWLPCRAIFFRDFWCSAIVWFTRCFCLPLAPLAYLLWKTSNVPRALMWTCVTVVYLIAGSVFTARLLSPHRSLRRSPYQSDDPAIPQFDSRRIAVRHTDPHRMEAV